jgi:UPF0148 protein
MEDKKISEAIRLLYKGAKMLPYHCPECGTPIFKYQDKMLCPSCGKEAIFESEAKEVIEGESLKDKIKREREVGREHEHPVLEIKDRGETKSGEIRGEVISDVESVEGVERLKKTLEFKLKDISSLLLDAKSPDEIDKLLTLLERILVILKDLKKEENKV